VPSSRRLAALLAAAPVLLAVLSTGPLAGPARAAGSDLTSTSTSGLGNGSSVVLTASGRAPGSSVLVLQCRAGDYPVGKRITDPVPVIDPTDGAHLRMERWNADCNPDLPEGKIDNSGRSQLGITERSGNLTAVMYVKQGTTSAQRPDVDYINPTLPVSYTCDAATPCRLVVVDGASYKVQQSFPISFASDAAAACGSPTGGTATGSGPFSVSATYTAWAVGSCATGTPTPLLADYTDAGEQSGLAAFANRENDFALSATGFSTPGGDEVPNDRPAVFTPVAVQAAVLAFDGNYGVRDAANPGGPVAGVPITELSMTMTEAASLFSSAFGTSAQKSPALVARNAQLSKITSNVQQTLVSPDGVLSTPDATVLAMTTAWAALPDSPWTRGALRRFPIRLGTGDNDTNQIPLLSNLPSLRTRVLGSIFVASGVPAEQVFVYLTDSATAAQLGLHTVKLQNTSGAFVAPTPASVALGVKGMKAGPDGLLVPDASNPDPGAYPLPLVQYAVSPRLLDTTVADGQRLFDAAHRDQLVSFLHYATGAGQDPTKLPTGVYPLPGPLLAQATASLATIGAPAASTGGTGSGNGGGGTTTPGSGGNPAAAVPLPPGLPGSLPVPVAGAVPTLTDGTPGVAPVAAPTPTATTAPVAIPVFTAASTSTLRGLLPTAGVLLLACLLCGAAYASAGRPLPGRHEA